MKKVKLNLSAQSHITTLYLAERVYYGISGYPVFKDSKPLVIALQTVTLNNFEHLSRARTMEPLVYQGIRRGLHRELKKQLLICANYVEMVVLTNDEALSDEIIYCSGFEMKK